MLVPSLEPADNENNMNEFHTNVTTSDGEMECFAVHPDGDGPYPAVILYMDVPGVREELRDFCRGIAERGYFCLLPDMYYREGKLRFDLSKGEEEMKKMFAAGMALSVAGIMRDTQGMLDYLDDNPTVSGPTGCIGYCMSGQYVVAAAGTFPDQIAAAASLYGVRIVTDDDDSPHLLASRIKGELYLGFAETDPYVEDNVIPDLKAALDEHGVTYTLETHPGTEHGFCFPQRPSYVEAAAEKVWATVFELYDRTLKN
jgi:carboxymethylenebutenolidase